MISCLNNSMLYEDKQNTQLGMKSNDNNDINNK